MVKRLLIGLVVLCGILVIGAALLVPRLVSSDAARHRITKVVRGATGREFVWRDLDVRILPARMVLSEAHLAGATPEDPAFAEARSISLHLSLLPLLAGAVVVDSLVIDGATVRLLRTEDGIAWPRPPERERVEPEEPRDPHAPRKPRDRRDPQLAVRRVDLRDVRVVLDDRAVSPPVTWDLSQLSGHAESEDWEGTAIRIDLAGRLAETGSLEASGYASADRSVQLCLDLDGISLQPFRSYLADGQDLAGDVSGRVHLRGAAGALGRLGVALTVKGAAFDLDEIRTRGDVEIGADLSGPPFEGPFQIDATEADFEAGSSLGFTKPSGMAAVAAGRLVPDAEGYGFDAVQVDIGEGAALPETSDPCAGDRTP